MNPDKDDVLEQGTELSGYEANGPYSCGGCEHFQGNVCIHPIVALDPQLEHPGEGQTSVDPETGCCRYIKQAAPQEESEPDADDIPSMLKGALKFNLQNS